MFPGSRVTGGHLPSSLPSALKQPTAFLFRVLRSAGKGSLGSGALHCVVRLFASKDSLASVQSVLLSGAVNSGLWALAKEAYAFGVHLLGDFQKNEEAIQAGQATVGNRMRQCCWKVIHSVDGFVDKIDAFVSKKLGIRTALELNVCIIKEPATILSGSEEGNVVDNYSNVREQKDLSILEVIRAVFWVSMIESALNMSMSYLSERVVERMGYKDSRSMMRMDDITSMLIGQTGPYTSLALEFLISLSLNVWRSLGAHEEAIRLNN
jgi:hypothetical protein